MFLEELDRCGGLVQFVSALVLAVLESSGDAEGGVHALDLAG